MQKIEEAQINQEDLLYEKIPNFDDRYLRPYGTVHGYDFGQTYNKDLVLDMKDRVIHSYHFDKDNSFVGFTLAGLDEKDKHTMYVAVGVDTDTMFTSRETFLFEDNYSDPDMTFFYGSTRLIGFRTGKECKQADFISMVQPIFYSTDEKVCKEHLTSLTPGMLDEMVEWGKECSDLTLNAMIKEFKASDENARLSEGYAGLTMVICLLCFVLVCHVAILQGMRWYNERTKLRLARQAEMRRGGEGTDNEADARAA